MKELLSNSAESTLASGITDSDTTLTVADASLFPSTGNFNLCIGEASGDRELVLVTAVSGDTFTIERGLEGAGFDTAGTPLAFAAGTPVAQVLSVRTLNRWGQDNLALWDSDRPALGRILNDAGDDVLIASDFTSTGSSATYTDYRGTIQTRKPATGGNSISCKVKSAPATPYSIISAWQAIVPGDSLGANGYFGPCFRKASDGKLVLLGLNTASAGKSCNWFTGHYDGATDAFSGSVTVSPLMFFGPEIWTKIEDDGTNLKLYVGDGIDWIQLLSESRTAYLSGGPDQVGWHTQNAAGTPDMLVRLVSRSVE